MKKRKAFWRRALLILLGLILGVNVYFANARSLVGNQLPMPFGFGMANVLSGSMEPTFSKGALIFVKEKEEINIGDIVVYQSGQELIVHRVIDKADGKIVTQGDANNVADEPFDESQIKGVVVGWIPVLGMIVGILKTPVAVILLLICAFLLIEGSFCSQKDKDDKEIEAIKEEIRRLKEEKDL